MVKEKAFLLLGNQLFPKKYLKKYVTDPIIMIESFELCTYEKHHKQKIKLFLSAMREYRDDLAKNKYKVCYHELNERDKKKKYIDILSSLAQKLKKLSCFEIEDKFFERTLEGFCKKKGIELEIIKSPMFISSREDFNLYLEGKKKPFMKTFYEKQRQQYNILLDKKGGPLGGKWSYDAENRKKMPKDYEPTHFEFKAKSSKYDQELNSLIEKNFAKHPGNLATFNWPCQRKDYLKILDFFLNSNLPDFGKYQDAISDQTPFLLHSLLSPGINLGLITPSEVIEKTVKHYYDNHKTIPLSSVEGFIRQVIGWREFVRGIYQNYSERQNTENYWNHQRKMKKQWYEGTTGLPPLDDSIKKAKDYGYCHHIERLMVLSNIMLLCEIHPNEVHSWFMEMFVDSSDWVMGPNVYGMGQFSDGGIFATKPYICGSNYIIKMSHYKKGDWSDILDGLYWRFVDKNISFFNKNPRMKMMVSHLGRMKPGKKKHLFSQAENFIEEVTK